MLSLVPAFYCLFVAACMDFSRIGGHPGHTPVRPFRRPISGAGAVRCQQIHLIVIRYKFGLLRKYTDEHRKPSKYSDTDLIP